MKPLPSVEDIFRKDEALPHADYYLQTLLYSLLVNRSPYYNPQGLPVSPALLFIQHAGAESYDPVLCFGSDRISSAANYRQQFGTLLMGIIREIFSPQQPFMPTAMRERCARCPFRLLCH